MKKIIQNILLIIIISTFSLLVAGDCYVLESANPDLSDGTEENPYSTIAECVTWLGTPDRDDTIYIGSGYYDATSIEVGPMSIVGSGVNVTKIYGSGSCFYGFKGTISNLSFDRYDFWQNGSNQSTQCATCINTAGDDNDYTPTLIYNVLFEEHSYKAIDINRPYVEIRNNVFIDDNSDIDFGNKDYITFMNNLIINDMNFNSFITANSNRLHNNLFLDQCYLPSFAGSTYNLVFRGGIIANGYDYGTNDTECGQTGQYQDSHYFENFDDLNFIVPTWNIYHIYASGENTILFDSGIHHPEFNDDDGSRSDIGIMGGLYPWPNSSGPVITNFQVDPIEVQIDGQINVNARSQTE
tara:strand:+ start:824 stop:1885 length:1062 start_codon:yes stop_codon:yes gene_type:complete